MVSNDEGVGLNKYVAPPLIFDNLNFTKSVTSALFNFYYLYFVGSSLSFSSPPKMIACIQLACSK